MSRDWTPRELHLADEECFEETGRYLHDRRITWHCGNNAPVDVSCKRFPEMYDKFPNLSFLFDAVKVKELFNEGCERALTLIESELMRTISKDGLDDYLQNNIVTAWYEGKLNGGTYDSTVNNSLFTDYIRLVAQTNTV